MSPRYAVKGKIGTGGLGEVYLATDTQLDRDVALKRVKPPESGSADGLHQDLIREARTLSSLQHPHIVTIYDVGQDEQGPFVVMELLKGETLDQVIERGALTVDDFKEVVVQSLEGMIAAQALGLVHRDLKPGNLMVIWLASGKFQIKILDFGLAKFSRTASRQTEDQEAGIMGSIFFMAPEQFERLPLDARTDMYSLGCIFYQILTTKYPFDGQTGPEVMVSHLQHQVRHLVEARPDLPVWLADWVMWLISRDMDDRPPDARSALDFFLAQKSGIKNPTPTGPAASLTGVKIVGRGTGPGGTTQPLPGKATQRVSGSASQSLQGTAAASRSSRPSPKKVARKSRTGLWFTLLLLAAAGGGAAWWFNRPPAPTADPRAALEAVLNAPAPNTDAATLNLLLGTLRTEGSDADRATEVLKRLKGTPVAEAIAAELSYATGAARLRLMALLGIHPSASGANQLKRIAEEESGPVRITALETLAKTGAASDIPALFKILPKIKEAPAREALLHTVQLLLAGERDSKARVRILTDTFDEADSALRPDLLRLLGQTRDGEANRVLAAEFAIPGDRRRDALAALSQWVSADARVVTALVDAANGSPADRDALLGGLCLILPRITSRNGAELTESLKEIKPLITSVKNREAFCSALAGTAAPEAAALAKELAADPEWAAPAQKAAAAITALQSQVTPLTQGNVPLDASKAVIMAAEKDLYYTSTSRYLTNWKDPASRVAWDVSVTAPTSVRVKVLQSSGVRHDRTFYVRLGNSTSETAVKPTDSNESFTTVDAGNFQIPRPGTWRLWLEPARMEAGQPLFNVRSLELNVK